MSFSSFVVDKDYGEDHDEDNCEGKKR